MLVITRKPNDKFQIRTPEGKIINITYLKCSKGKQIRLGIEADSDVIIDRQDRFKEDGGTHDESTAESIGNG